SACPNASVTIRAYGCSSVPATGMTSVQKVERSEASRRQVATMEESSPPDSSTTNLSPPVDRALTTLDTAVRTSSAATKGSLCRTLFSTKRHGDHAGLAE